MNSWFMMFTVFLCMNSIRPRDAFSMPLTNTFNLQITQTYIDLLLYSSASACATVECLCPGVCGWAGGRVCVCVCIFLCGEMRFLNKNK